MREGWRRLLAVMLKEFIQLKRDRLTFAMMIGVPLLQLTLFGYAINGDPKHLPAVVVAADHGPFSRALVSSLENTGYFDLHSTAASGREADALLQAGKVQFVLTIPSDFSRRLVRGEQPAVLLEADATDPSAVGNAVAAVQQVASSALQRELAGVLALPQGTPPVFELRVHRRYNPEGSSQFNVVPGLMGVILTMTMIMMTALGLTREVERGTMENLLATPVRPFEVMVGKILPYIIIGMVQVVVILAAARWMFAVPFVGHLLWLLLVVFIFIAANLVVGITISSVARNQTQAMQMTFFFFLPSMLLSGFMFPFRGMPGWAQTIGELLPLTHFMRASRGVMLKGNGWFELWPHVWPLLVFLCVVMLIGLKRFRRTLD